ncbi:MAG: GrpB family protein [Candidatus Komeilibacteria bacterium]
MKKIGLKRGTVKILLHQNSWHLNFEKEKKLILSLNNKHIKAIEHVGSTAVPNMPAKPIIDLNIGIDNFYNSSKLIKPLSKIGYKFTLKPRRFQWLFVKQDGEYQTHYLKIIKYKGHYWKEYQAFKAKLSNNKKAFKQYKTLKLRQGLIYSEDRKKYTANKAALIKEILYKA